MSDPARALWARSIARNNRRSTIFLTLFAAVHLAVPLLAGAVLLLLANAIALWPGLQAGRGRISDALHAE